MADDDKRNNLIIFLLIGAAVVLGVLVFILLPGQGQTGRADNNVTEEPEKPAAVIIGGREYTADTESLQPDGVTYDELVSELEKFTSLKTLDISRLGLSNDEIYAVISMLPDTEVVFDVKILGQVYSHDEEYIDLSQITEQDAEAVASALRTLKQLREVVLPAQEAENNLPLSTIAMLREAAPGAAFDYKYKLLGRTITLEDTEIIFEDKDIGNDGVDIFYELLPCMPGLERLVLDDCGIDNEVMAELRDAFPEKSIVWRVRWNGYSTLTDAQVIRSVGLTISSADVLKYCTEARFVDLGHSEALENIEFARYMPKLQMLIVADSAIESIEPLSGCSELMMLEIVNCWNLTGIEALSECKKLKFLNLSNANEVKDLSPIFKLTELERVYAAKSKIPESQVEELKKLHPDCIVTFEMPETSLVSYNYSIGWRLDAAPKVMAEWYIELQKIFGIGYDLYDSDGYYSYKHARPYDFPLDELKIFALDQE